MQTRLGIKRSARYHALEGKLPSKSGASAEEVLKMTVYKEKWLLKDAMSFYTPPGLRKKSNLTSITNLSEAKPSTSSNIQDESSNLSIASTVGSDVSMYSFEV